MILLLSTVLAVVQVPIPGTLPTHLVFGIAQVFPTQTITPIHRVLVPVSVLSPGTLSILNASSTVQAYSTVTEP